MAACARRLAAGSEKSSRGLVRRTSTRTEVSANQTTTASFRTTSTKAYTSARNYATAAQTATKTCGAALRSHQTLLRSAIGAELGSLRYLSYLVEGGAEPNLLRGWDDGIVDTEGDDGT